MEGRATLTMVTSRPTMSRLIEQISRMPILRLRLSSWMATAGPFTCRTIIMWSIQISRAVAAGVDA